uniref:ROK family transcriptional regulator n=1 Tax=Pararhizobium sp. IMCC3301 TaxID=3067904 RepID=UPI002740C800|nr:ROK family transcriptional regulator [Pararhizobium sp. IMCC3301]
MRLERSRPIIGSNAERTRLHNRQVVLGLVRRHQPVGRAEIARQSGLSTQAISNIIAELEDEAFLHTAGRQTRGRGLPAVQYMLNKEGGFALGIEVRPDAMFAALVNLAGEPRFTQRVALGCSAPASVTALANDLMQQATAQIGLSASALLGVGVVMPGPFGQIGQIGESAPVRSELEGWEGVDPVGLFEQALGTQVVVENDATAAAVAERIGGVAQNLKSYCYIYFGAGLGLGVVADGQVMRGAYGNAGEIGHVTVQSGTRSGHLESFASRIAVRDHLAAAGLAVENVDDLNRLHRQGNPHLLAWIREAAAPLSQAIGMVENLFDPEAVILGGAMPDALLDDLIAILELPDASVARREGRALPRVLRGASGRMTAALGGAALVIHDAFTPRIVARV